MTPNFDNYLQVKTEKTCHKSLFYTPLDSNFVYSNMNNTFKGVVTKLPLFQYDRQ